MSKIISIILFLFLGQLSMHAQTFKAYAAAGLNAGQIDGDFEVGYNKLGFTGGVGVGFSLSPQLFLGTEFLFSQRGSSNAIFDQEDEINGSISLNYIELPIMLRLQDWYDEENKFYKVWAETGLSVARLINANIEGSNVPDLINEFNSTDLSFILGAGVNVTEHIFVNFRYTRSLLPLYVNPDPQINSLDRLIPYFLSLRVGYSF